MAVKAVITLTTDFGCDDHFVGVMKGVILGINPDAALVDLTHGIGPQDVLKAAMVIGMNYRYFPEGSIHVAVVDPGVGSTRRPILVLAAGHAFLGPDNGLFSLIYREEGAGVRVYHMTADKYFLPVRSNTFHGRDVFAPAAAWLSRGIDASLLGGKIDDYLCLPTPFPPRREGGKVHGEVVLIDHFGNAVTNISRSDADGLASPSGVRPSLFFRGRQVPLVDCYAEGEGRGLSAVVDSSGLTELFVFRGSAAEDQGIAVGDPVELREDRPA